MPVFWVLSWLLLFTSYHEVYFDNQHIYIKEYYKKEYQKFSIEDIEYIDHKILIPFDVIKINGNKYHFAISRRLYFKRDILSYIKKEAMK